MSPFEGRFFFYLWNRYRPLVTLCLSWIAVFVPFNLWWQPENRIWWLFVAPPISLLLGLPLVATQGPGWHWDSERRVRALSVLLLASLFVVNFFGSILPSSRPGNNLNLVLVEQVGVLSRPGDVIIGLDRGTYKNALPYLHYFAGLRTVGLAYSFVSEDIDRALAQHREMLLQALENGQQVFVLADVLGPGIGHEHIAQNAGLAASKVRDDIDTLFVGFGRFAVIWAGTEPLVYQLLPGSE